MTIKDKNNSTNDKNVIFILFEVVIGLLWLDCILGAILEYNSNIRKTPMTIYTAVNATVTQLMY